MIKGKIITDTGVTVYVSGYAPFTIARSHKLFDDLIDAIRNEDEDGIVDIINAASKTVDYLEGKVNIIDGEVFYGSEQVVGNLVDRILSCMHEDIDASGLLLFLENLMQNPSKQSREELYLFLEACGDLPITEDGRFIAYKWVRSNYKDVHSNSFDNSVGSIVKMARRDVNDDRRQTCSSGLHVCSKKYCKFGDKLMLVAVNPRDVVSVPNDYDNGKMRVCEYEVIEEVDTAEYITFDSPMYTFNNEQDEE